MREELVRHFDVVVVIWVLALAVGWSMVALARAPLSDAQWSTGAQSGPAWVVPADSPRN
jgi:heme A synthase